MSPHATHRCRPTLPTDVAPRYPEMSPHATHRCRPTLPTDVAPRYPEMSPHATQRWSHAEAASSLDHPVVTIARPARMWMRAARRCGVLVSRSAMSGVDCTRQVVRVSVSPIRQQDLANSFRRRATGAHVDACSAPVRGSGGWTAHHKWLESPSPRSDSDDIWLNLFSLHQPARRGMRVPPKRQQPPPKGRRCRENIPPIKCACAGTHSGVWVCG